jgi:hypothetical protein
MKTVVTPVRFAALAVSAFWIPAPAAIAQTLHPAELAGIKSTVGAATQITFPNGSTQDIRVYWIDYHGNPAGVKTRSSLPSKCVPKASLWEREGKQRQIILAFRIGSPNDAGHEYKPTRM